MVLWAVKTFGEVLWIDWDTINLRPLDQQFWDWCHAYDTPKFVYIPNYWAVVNCSVYYVSEPWAKAMECSFYSHVSEPNDELLWANVLPKNIQSRPEFWWEDRVLNIWTPEECNTTTDRTYFAHVRYLEFVNLLKRNIKSVA